MPSDNNHFSIDEYIKKGSFYEAVVEDGADIIMIVDYDGNIRYNNPSVQETLGYSKQELLGQNFIELNHPDFQENLRNIFKTISEQQYTDNIEFYFKTKKGDYTFFEFNSINLHHKDGINGLILDCRDISQRKKDQEELVKAQKAKELFLANMSHEIRTPISGIAGMVTLLEKFDANPEERKYLNAIKHSADHLKIIINDILDFAAIEAGKLSFEHIGFKPVDQLENVVNSFEFNTREKGLTLEFVIQGNPETIVLGDPVRLNQVLVNLVNNAIKFTPSGGIILKMTILEKESGKVKIRFSVKDTGIGIPEDKKRRIFESFSQADASINRRFGGTGLGLSISKHIVEIQGGGIWVESEVDKGSEFFFEIPFDEGTSNDLSEIHSDKQHDPEHLVGLKVLLVEDNEINRLYAKKVLEGLECKIVVAENGKQALDQFNLEDFEVILMDLQMPVLDGFEATRIIREKFPSPKNSIPIIALTANAIKGDNEKCIEAGMNDYLSKPFSPEQLRFKILNLIKSRNAEEFLKKADSETKSEIIENRNGSYNLTYLKQICGNNEDFIKEMVTTFVKSTPEFLDQIEIALNNQDDKQIAKVVHKLKPSCSFMGLSKVQQFLIEIESTQNGSLPPTYQKTVSSFVYEIRTALKELSKLY